MPKVPAPGVEERVLHYAATQPEWGQFTVAKTLRGEGLSISPSGVRGIWKRHGLETLYQRVLVVSSEPAGGVSLDARQKAHFTRVTKRRALQQADALRDPTKESGTRELLLTVAADEFQQHGFRGTVLKDIAEKAGMLPGSLYHYFKSKQDLLEQVHEASFKELNTALDAALENVTDPMERLRRACRSHLELLVSGGSLSGFVRMRLFVPSEGELNAKMMRDRNAYERRMGELIGAAVHLEGVDPTIVRLALFGALNWSQVWYRPGRKTPAQIADDLVRIFTGVVPRAKSPAVAS